MRAHFPIKAVAVHAEVQSRIAMTDNPRQQHNVVFWHENMRVRVGCVELTIGLSSQSCSLQEGGLFRLPTDEHALVE